MAVEIFGIVPWAALSAAATWYLAVLKHGREMKKINLDHAATIDVSRDDLAVELLSSARAEVITARSEMEALRDEIKVLRSMEQHFYHFQQALEHLSAVLFAKNHAEKTSAERSARAFLKRMARLREAKGTIANEAQRVDAMLTVTEKIIRDEGGQI